MLFGNYRELQGHLIHARLIAQNINGFRKKDFWAQFFKRWIAISKGKTTTRGTSGTVGKPVTLSSG